MLYLRDSVVMVNEQLCPEGGSGYICPTVCYNCTEPNTPAQLIPMKAYRANEI
jgi:hypothetical protein